MMRWSRLVLWFGRIIFRLMIITISTTHHVDATRILHERTTHHDIINDIALLRETHPNIPVLYNLLRNDGSGSEVKSFIMISAYCGHRGWLYGGAFEDNMRSLIQQTASYRNEHGVEVEHIVNSFFKRRMVFPPEDREKLFNSSYSVLHLDVNSTYSLNNLTGPPWEYDVIEAYKPDLHEYRNLCSIRSVTAGGGKHQRYYVLNDIMSDKFLHRMRSTFLSTSSTHELFFDVSRPTVAIHVRRGRDVGSDYNTKWFTEDSFYFDMVKSIRSVFPNADIHVFSSLEGVTKNSSFAEYRRLKLAVHFEDESDVRRTWVNMMNADILVMAKSSFSWVAAVLNPNCVIWQPRPTRENGAMNHWMPASDVTAKYLRKCWSR